MEFIPPSPLSKKGIQPNYAELRFWGPPTAVLPENCFIKRVSAQYLQDFLDGVQRTGRWEVDGFIMQIVIS